MTITSMVGMGYSHGNTQELEMTRTGPLDSSGRAIDHSPCQPHLDLNYAEMRSIANNKPEDLLIQEQQAAEQLHAALSNDAGVNERLSKLTNEQLRIFFPCIYVEAKHDLNPITAYNSKDAVDSDVNHDDNIAMLRGYGDFLTAVKEAAEGKGKPLEARAERLLDRYHDLAGILINKDSGNVFEASKYQPIYKVSEKRVFKHEDIPAYTKASPTHQAKTISCGHQLAIVRHDNILHHFCLYKPNEKDIVMREILMKYISAIDAGNVDDIFQATADYQFLHLLPNANGRSSQIMRDCALMHLGYLPLSSLTMNSHYLSPQEPVDHEHILFMQKNSEEILSAVEQKNLTLSLCKRNTPVLAANLVADAKTDAIKFDVQQFLGEVAEKYFAPQSSLSFYLGKF